MKQVITEIEFSILENGLDFIHEAAKKLQELQSVTEVDDIKRLLKYAVLHTSSGIELILKHRLHAEHWTYVFQDMNKADEKTLNNGELKSTDSSTTVERLKKLCQITLDFKDKYKNLRNFRNKMEHFSFKVNDVAIKNTLQFSISMIVNFICKHTDVGNLSKEETLLQEIKTILRDLNEHYKEAIKLANKEMKDKSVGSVHICPECGEDFFAIIDDNSAHCFFCNYEKDMGKEMANAGVNNRHICPECEGKFFAIIDDICAHCFFCNYETNGLETAQNLADSYIKEDLGITVRNGIEYPRYECPSCEYDTFVYYPKDGIVKCFYCYSDFDLSKIAICNDCGKPFYLSAENLSACGECMARKEDRF